MVAATKTKRVLVVDDEEIVRESYKLALTDAGYEVYTVSNGQDAIRACRSDHFDVMLADIRMPDMDGLEVSRVVTREFPDVRVVVITGYPSPETAARARRIGCVDFVEKPVAPDRLSALTAAALAHGPVVIQEDPEADDARSMADVSLSAKAAIPQSEAPAQPPDDMPTAVAEAAVMIPVTPAATKDISPLTAGLVMLTSPLIGLAYFLLFPFIGTGIALAVIVKELLKAFRSSSD